MQTHLVKDIIDYLTILKCFDSTGIARWHYRGHGDSRFDLTPSLFRHDVSDVYSKWEQIEEYLILKFQREAMPYLLSIPTNREELLVLAQHHGLPTRLLDWSTNPLVALYFAVEAIQHGECEANVWCLGLPSLYNCHPESTWIARLISTDMHGLPIFTNLSDRVIYPSHITQRVTNQAGCFTIHSFPEYKKSFIPLNQRSEEMFGGRLIRLVIPSAAKNDIINDLYELGIHKGFIFPDLDGITGKIKFELETRHKRI